VLFANSERTVPRVNKIAPSNPRVAKLTFCLFRRGSGYGKGQGWRGGQEEVNVTEVYVYREGVVVIMSWEREAWQGRRMRMGVFPFFPNPQNFLLFFVLSVCWWRKGTQKQTKTKGHAYASTVHF
jgi:hypothetical protein